MRILTINTLGGISISRGEKVYEDKLSQKSLAIICFLLCSHGMKTRKNKLTSLFWADSDPLAAKSNLRFNIWSIRKILGQDERGEEFLLSDRGYARINPDYHFESDILSIKAFDRRTSSTADLARFKECFKGSYLEGFHLSDCDEYSDVILVERIACQNIQMEVLESIYDGFSRSGDHLGCIRTMSEALIIDPFNETYAHHMLEHMAAMNSLTQAIGFYKDFAVRLRKNLNIAPSQQLQAMNKRLLSAQGEVHSPLLQMREDAAKPFQVTVCCIAGIDYYWMAECIEKIADRRESEIARSVPQEVLSDLSHIYPKFGAQKTSAAEILPIRLYYAFREYLACAARVGGLEIVTENVEEMDEASSAFMRFISRKPLPGVRFAHTS